MQILVTIDAPDRLSSFFSAKKPGAGRSKRRELEGLVKELVQPPEVIQRMKTFLQN